MFGNRKQSLVCVRFHLRIAVLSCVAKPAEPDLDAHRLLGQVLAHALNLNQMHWHSCHVVFLLSRFFWSPDPALTSGPDLEMHASTRAVRRAPADSSGCDGIRGPNLNASAVSFQAGTPSTGNP